MSATGRTSKVEEESQCRGIGTLGQLHIFPSEDIWSVGCNVFTLREEEVVVARVGELEGHLWQVGIGLNLNLHMISLRATGSKLSINVELALPLRATQTLRKSQFIGITTVGSGAIINWAPTIVGKVITE